jgi:hypothetical protein
MLLQSRAAFLEGLLAAGPAMVNALPPPACNPADPFEYSRLRFFDTCVKANKHARVRSLGGISCFCLFVCACVRVLSRKYARCGLHAGTSRGISRHVRMRARPHESCATGNGLTPARSAARPSTGAAHTSASRTMRRWAARLQTRRPHTCRPSSAPCTRGNDRRKACACLSAEGSAAECAQPAMLRHIQCARERRVGAGCRMAGRLFDSAFVATKTQAEQSAFVSNYYGSLCQVGRRSVNMRVVSPVGCTHGCMRNMDPRWCRRKWTWKACTTARAESSAPRRSRPL